MTSPNRFHVFLTDTEAIFKEAWEFGLTGQESTGSSCCLCRNAFTEGSSSEIKLFPITL